MFVKATIATDRSKCSVKFRQVLFQPSRRLRTLPSGGCVAAGRGALQVRWVDRHSQAAVSFDVSLDLQGLSVTREAEDPEHQGPSTHAGEVESQVLSISFVSRTGMTGFLRTCT